MGALASLTTFGLYLSMYIRMQQITSAAADAARISSRDTTEFDESMSEIGG